MLYLIQYIVDVNTTNFVEKYVRDIRYIWLTPKIMKGLQMQMLWTQGQILFMWIWA